MSDAPAAPTIGVRNPFVGPRSLRPGEALFGREVELDELRDSLIADRVVLLFSPSGAGKSSLLEAGLRGVLEGDRYRDRFFVAPTIRINQEGPGNRYVSSALRSLAEATSGALDDDQPAGQSLLDYVDRHLKEQAGKKAIVLIFDQFEEVFTLDRADFGVKEEFFGQLGELLRDRRIWAVIAMRDDYIGHLEPHLGVFPSRLATRLRLDFLARDAALAAVQLPARAVGVEITDDAARLLVSDLSRVTATRGGVQVTEPGPYVEPVQLQVVCSQLWNRLPAETTVITKEHVEQYANTDNALAHFYADRVAAAAGATGVPERAIREWFETTLITPQGFRSQSFEFPGDRGSDVLVALENSYLVRAETRRGVKWYELTHDRMVAPVLEDNAAWREERLSPLQKRAAEWVATGRPDGLLVSGEVLTNAETWLAGATDATAAEREFVDDSRSAQNAADAERKQRDDEVRRARRRLASVAALSVVSVVAAVAVVFALVVSSRAAADRETADRAKEEAETALVTAEDATQKADVATKTANDATNAARELEREAEARALASRALTAADPYQAALLALEAQARTDEPVAAARASWQSAVARLGRQPLIRTGPVVDSGTKQAVAVAWSPTPARLATINEDGMVRLFDGTTRERLAERPTGDKDGTNLAWSPDGSRLATVNGDGSLRLFDADLVPVGEPVTASALAAYGVAWSPDGTRLATAGADGTVRLFDVGLTEIASVPLGTESPDPESPDPLESAMWSVAWSSAGIAATDGSGRLWVLDPENLTVTAAAVPIEGGGIGWMVEWSPDDSTLAAVHNDGNLRLFTPDLEPVGEPVTTGESLALSVRWSPDGEVLATTNDDGALRLFDRDLNTVGDPVVTADNSTYASAWSRDGGLLAVVNADASLRFFTYTPPAEVDMHLPSESLRGGRGVALSPDGTRLATISLDGFIRLFDRATFAPLDREVLVGSTGLSLAWSPDDRIAVTTADGALSVFDGESLDRLDAFNGEADAAGWMVTWSPDGAKLATANYDGTVTIFEAADLTPRVIEVAIPGAGSGAQPTRAYAVSWSPDSSRLAVITENGHVRVHEASTGELVDEVAAVGKGYGSNVAWSPDGTLIAAVNGDGTLSLFDAELDLIGETSTGGKAARGLVWSPTSDVVVTSNENRSIRFFDAPSLDPIGDPVALDRSFGYALAWVPPAPGRAANTDTLVVVMNDDTLGTLRGLSAWPETAACTYLHTLMTPTEMDELVGIDGLPSTCGAGQVRDLPPLPASLRPLP